jgi:hypothetical protein
MIFGCKSQSNPTEELILISTAEWGGTMIPHNAKEHTIKYITIHHGGVIFKGDSSTASYLKNLQSWSRDVKKWIDIPYHFVMDLKGDIYQARPVQYPGDTNTEYDPTGHLLICILGNYEEQELNEDQYQKLILFLSYFSHKYDVPIEKIKSHKDYAETACPGKNIYKFLQDGSLITDVQKKLTKINDPLNK